MKKYNKVFMIFFILLLMAYVSCQKDNPVSVSSLKTDAPVSLKVNFIESNKNFLGGQSSKQNVNYVEVKITGVGLSNPINLVLTISNNQARGNVNLPFGVKDIEVTASVKSGSTKIPLFSGVKGVSITESTSSVTIDLTEIVENEVDFYWHDGSFENTFYSSYQGDILSAYFNVGQPIFVKGISLKLFWEGNSGDYRLIVKDASRTTHFRSANPIHAGSDGWVSWNLIWGADPTIGIFSGGFYAGFEYATNAQWPDIGYDYDPYYPSGNSWYYKSDENSWYWMNNGDFAITVTVQTQSGKILKLSPTKILNPEGKEMPSISINKAK